MTDHPTRLLMLDSGAFSVWTQGVTIDLTEYAAFCEAHPDCSYYVNLDVIPGKPGDKSTLTKDAVEASCKQGWKNYRYLLDRLPLEKVIPVFHQGDNVRWLDKYISFGTPYIGISPANDRQASGSNHKATFKGRETDQITTKLQWMRMLRPFLFDGAGRPVIKTHGFAVTSYDLMTFWDWHSVDSASWKLVGAWGGIYLPRIVDKEFVYNQQPQIVSVSPVSTDLERLAGRECRRQIDAFLEFCGVPFGSFKTKQADEDYKLNRETEEIWFDKAKRIVLVPTEKGVVTAVEERLRVNAEFIKQANKVLPIRHIYFAGALMPYPLEFQLGRRLLSYHHIQGRAGQKRLQQHLELVKSHKERKASQ